MRDRTAARAWIEITAMTALILSHVWLWRDAFTSHRAVLLVTLLALGIAGHRTRGEGLRDIGIRLDNLGPSLVEATLWFGGLIMIVLAAGWALGSTSFKISFDGALHLLERGASGLIGQYVLLAFYYRRSREALPGRVGPTLLACALAALLALPNPLMATFSFVVAVVSCRLYARTPNLFVLGIAHAVLWTAVSGALPIDLTFAERTGRGFFELWRQMQTGSGAF